MDRDDRAEPARLVVAQHELLEALAAHAGEDRLVRVPGRHCCGHSAAVGSINSSLARAAVAPWLVTGDSSFDRPLAIVELLRPGIHRNVLRQSESTAFPRVLVRRRAMSTLTARAFDAEQLDAGVVGSDR
jgi:hypothetical protein